MPSRSADHVNALDQQQAGGGGGTAGGSADEQSAAKGTSRQDDVNKSDQLFTLICRKLLHLFERDRDMFDQRGRLVIRQLCSQLDVEKFYRTIASLVFQEEQNLVRQEEVFSTDNGIGGTASGNAGVGFQNCRTTSRLISLCFFSTFCLVWL